MGRSLMVDLRPVVSSNINAIGHDPDKSELHVQFANGGHYVYSGVSAAQHQALMTADSIGSHLHKFIKSKATGVRKHG